MSLWDLIKPKNKTIDYVNNMPPLQAPEMEAIQVQDDGQGGLTMANTPTGANKPVNFLNRLENKRQGLGNTLSGLLFGKQSQPTDYADTNGDVLNVGISSNPRVGGLVPDIVAGFRENANTRFNPENLSQNILDDGRNKGFAYRLGEGLGTIGRVLESPLGRGLITAGIVGATGGSGLEALAYGGQTGVLNQNLRNADNLYRQQLKDNYGFTDEKLNQRKGYIDANTFNNLTKSQNSALNLALRQQTTETMNRLRELQIEKQRIINSTLPEEQKLRLMKLNAEATHAEEMQLARINYYNNSASLGWANFGLRANEDQRKAEMDAMKKELMRELAGNNGTEAIQTADKPKGRAF